MLKFVIILTVFISLVNTQSQIEIAKKYCSTNNCPAGKSIACQYTTNPNMKCNGKLQNINRDYIIKLHNNRRNRVALGQLAGYKQAVQMEQIQWSAELEQMAKYNVMTCKFDHDECRNTNNFKQSGQNLYTKWGTGIENTNPNEIVRDGINSWFDEYKQCDMTYINKYRSSDKQIGHFTAMMRENNNYVGCAQNKFQKNDKTNYLFACNYATTNIMNRPIYKAGSVGSQCPNGVQSLYRGLCKP